MSGFLDAMEVHSWRSITLQVTPRIHTVLYEQMLDSLSPWKPSLSPDVALVPGKQFHEDAAKYFCAKHPYEALGAVIVGEIYASQFFVWLNGELARQGMLDLTACAWHNAHVVLEVEHAQNSARIAELIPDSEAHQAAVWRGAQGMGRTLRAFLDNLQRRYSLCPPQL